MSHAFDRATRRRAEVWRNSRRWADPAVKAQRRQLAALAAQSGMVFQAHNLFPHRITLENVIEGPVIVQGVPRQHAIERANALLAKVGLAVGTRNQEFVQRNTEPI